MPGFGRHALAMKLYKLPWNEEWDWMVSFHSAVRLFHGASFNMASRMMLIPSRRQWPFGSGGRPEVLTTPPGDGPCGLQVPIVTAGSVELHRQGRSCRGQRKDTGEEYSRSEALFFILVSVRNWAPIVGTRPLSNRSTCLLCLYQRDFHLPRANY